MTYSTTSLIRTAPLKLLFFLPPKQLKDVSSVVGIGELLAHWISGLLDLRIWISGSPGLRYTGSRDWITGLLTHWISARSQDLDLWLTGAQEYCVSGLDHWASDSLDLC